MQFIQNDGGRAEAGYKGTAGDCVVRAIAIVAELPYQEVYDELFKLNKVFSEGRGKKNKKVKTRGATPRNGNYKQVYIKYLEQLGFQWIPCMTIGSGCKVHLTENELPKGRIIVKVSKHLAAVVDGILHDTHDCSREGTRCVYGCYQRK